MMGFDLVPVTRNTVVPFVARHLTGRQFSVRPDAARLPTRTMIFR